MTNGGKYCAYGASGRASPVPNIINKKTINIAMIPRFILIVLDSP